MAFSSGYLGIPAKLNAHSGGKPKGGGWSIAARTGPKGEVESSCELTVG
jgi:hypothetical protein